MKKKNILILNPDLSIKTELVGRQAAAEYLGITMSAVENRAHNWRRHHRNKNISLIKKQDYKELILKEIEKARLSIQAANLKLHRIKDGGQPDPVDIQQTRDLIKDKKALLERFKGLLNAVNV